MAERLTEGFVKTLKPPARGSRLIWDSELTGFALRVFAPARRIRPAPGPSCCPIGSTARERRFRIGSWPDWSATAARDEAKGSPAPDRSWGGSCQR